MLLLSACSATAEGALANTVPIDDREPPCQLDRRIAQDVEENGGRLLGVHGHEPQEEDTRGRGDSNLHCKRAEVAIERYKKSLFVVSPCKQRPIRCSRHRL